MMDDFKKKGPMTEIVQRLGKLEKFMLETKRLWGLGGSGGDSKFGSNGLIGNNNAGTPNTKMDFSADMVALRNPSGGIVIRTNTGTITCDLTLPASGSTSTANGCDQSKISALTSVWVHFYWIWNGTTLATLASQVSPPTGPTLPSGYTHWAYIGAVFLDASSHLLVVKIRGNNFFYIDEKVLVNGGNAVVETSFSTSGYVPPNALTVFGKVTAIYTNTSANTTGQLDIRIVSGNNFIDIQPINAVANVNARSDIALLMPNLSQTAYYIWANTPGSTRGLYFICTGYTVPSGST